MMMPQVKNCTLGECYYNREEICHANAITIGSDHQMCDTFIADADRHGTPADIGRVGACHQSDCHFNEERSCGAGSINVDYHQEHGDCVTFEARPTEEDADFLLFEETSEVEESGSSARRLDQIE
jgi:hypothetical protein